jgi:hypothetical protein
MHTKKYRDLNGLQGRRHHDYFGELKVISSRSCDLEGCHIVPMENEEKDIQWMK